jgi:hypothetical protein
MCKLPAYSIRNDKNAEVAKRDTGKKKNLLLESREETGRYHQSLNNHGGSSKR